MTKVIFYEKPGCINNAKQKALLWAAGHEVIAYNLLKTPWTVASLRPFFGDRPVTEWFNEWKLGLKLQQFFYRYCFTYTRRFLRIGNCSLN